MRPLLTFQQDHQPCPNPGALAGFLAPRSSCRLAPAVRDWGLPNVRFHLTGAFENIRRTLSERFSYAAKNSISSRL